MSKFEDHLWREVARQHGPDVEHAGRPQPRHTRLRARMLAGGSILGLAGAGTAAALVLGAASASPAFAVTRNHDGTVTVWVKRSSGIAGANAKLHQLGVRAMVLPQAPARCSDLPITQQGAPAPQGKNFIAPRGNVIAPRGSFTDAHWTIDRKIPPGQVLALTPAPGPSLTHAPGPAGNSGNSGTAGNSGNSGSSGTATTSGSQAPAPSVNWQTTTGQVWTCNVPAQPTPSPGAGSTGTTGNSG
jgi:hypothetical protein